MASYSSARLRVRYVAGLKASCRFQGQVEAAVLAQGDDQRGRIDFEPRHELDRGRGHIQHDHTAILGGGNGAGAGEQLVLGGD